MIEIIQGDLLKADTDTIVNPANSHLAHGGGVARLIANAAAGPEADSRNPFRPSETHYEWQREQRDHPLIPTGGAGWTSAGCLPYKGIVHAVGPVWGGGSFAEEVLLYSAHAEALNVAAQYDCASVAFPAISCGIFGYPVEKAAPVAVAAAHNYLALRTGVERVVFCLFEAAHFAAYQEAAGELAV